MRVIVNICCLLSVLLVVENVKLDDNFIENVPEIIDTNLLVEVPNGKLLGRDNGFYYSYESIPYAEPPVDDLRFEAPKPYEQIWEKVFDARRIPPVCMQWDQLTDDDDKLLGQEDCLKLSIYKPKTISTNEKLPVLILIHGGAFMFGAGIHYNHEELMKRGNFIVVKLAYRLGPLGFLSTEDDSITGNFGLKDQRLALQWVKNNIAQFGGDSECILVTGFSAGGASVHLHLMKKDLGDYVKAAISFSGTANNPWVLMHNARERAFKLGELTNCSVENSTLLKKCLKEKPAEDIVRAVRAFLIFGYNPFATFGPVVEDANAEEAFITKTLEQQVKSGEVADVPWLATYTAQDGGYNAAELAQITPNGKELIEIFNEKWLDLAPHVLFFKNPNSEGARSLALALKQDYLGDKNFTIANYGDLQRMYTDLLFKNGVEEAVRLHKDIPGGAPVYVYRYDNAGDRGYAQVLAKRNDIHFGCVHGDDLLLIFPNPVRNAELRSDEAINAGYLFEMLENFVKTGEPSFGPNKFINNVGKSDLQLMFITGTNGESRNIDKFP